MNDQIQIPQQDALLQTIVLLVEEDDKYNGTIGITLIAGGLLISGWIVRRQDFCKSHDIAEAINKERTQMENVQLSRVLGSTIRTPGFVHLKKARYFTPSGAPIPEKAVEISVRINLAHVTGFQFGLVDQ